MKKIFVFMMSLVLIMTSIPTLSFALTNNQEASIVISNELSSNEQSLIDNDNLESGIYINEKCRSFFDDLLTGEALFSISESGYLVKNTDTVSILEDDYDKIVDYTKTGRKLIISMNENHSMFENTLIPEEKISNYLIYIVNDTTDIVVFDSTVLIDYDELLFYDDLIDIVDYIEDREEFENEEVTSSNESSTEINENTTASDNSEDFTDETVTDESKNESSVETTNDEKYSEEDRSDFISEEETNANSKDSAETDSDDEKINVLSNESVIEVSSEIISKIRMSAFVKKGNEFKNNSIYVSDELINYFDSLLETWYENEYIMNGNEIIINPELILNSSNNVALDNGIQYIFLGQDDEGNLLSVKVSDNINKTNGILQLMNSNYSTIIISFDALEENDIIIDSEIGFCLLYCGDQLIVAINNTYCSENAYVAKNSFNSSVSSFLATHKINKIQPFGIAVGNPIVYSGPGKESYAAVGSLNAFETYETIYKELGFQYIEYKVDGTNTLKRGYIDQYGGGSGTIPSNYSYGQGGNVKSSCTVYSGPSSSYATVGSVSSGESVTLLSQTRIASNIVYWYLEYSSSSGSKRGYVLATNITTNDNTGLGVTLNDIEVYDSYVVNSGSLCKNEYFVITGYNDNYYKIEYNITTNAARKTGYVFKSEVQSINKNATFPRVANSDAIHAKPKQTTSVYAGPSAKIYANIGSVYATDTVGVLGKEGSYYYIQYSTSLGSKRGYVSMSSLNSFSGSGSIKSTGVENADAYADAPTSACTVYSCPDDTSATIGSIGIYEGITVFPSIKDNGFTFVEYSTVANTKRGFIKSSLLKGYNEGVNRRANSDTTVYYTTAADLALGSIYSSEYVIVLGKTGGYYYIEYNSPSGRKRGYAKSNVFGSVSNVPNIDTTGESISMNSDKDVYSGPYSTYANIGSVSKDEHAILISRGTRGWYLIEYATANGNKQGYIPKSAATVISKPVNDEIIYPDYPNATKHKSRYTSGLGRDLVYYTIGDPNSDNVLFLNFAIHGHEDQDPGDGMGLVNMAFRTISTLCNNYQELNSNNWLVVIIPTFNPDGIIDGDNCIGNCKGVGRHNAVQMKNDDGTWSKYTDGLGHIDMNRCFPYDAAGHFDKKYESTSEKRNYTGPFKMMAYEAEALNELLQEYKTKTGTKYFIDVHGWTRQIIFAGSRNDSPFVKAFFNHGFGNNSLTNTLNENSANGYVAKYALALGYQACLFEFPGDADWKSFYNDTYGDNFLTSIKYLLDI